jgi:hypothetical protein
MADRVGNAGTKRLNDSHESGSTKKADSEDGPSINHAQTWRKNRLRPEQPDGSVLCIRYEPFVFLITSGSHRTLWTNWRATESNATIPAIICDPTVAPFARSIAVNF